ncbi:flagellar biosynthetic protein FliR [Meinhardsimonia xiamenensis]|jgi:flagellar biosynthetic protein FliR|nr:flagellar biosynthetic protein FliR [Meinhardsimonia xiamenensis]
MALLWSVVFFRVGAAMALLPGFGSLQLSVRVRLVLALAFTAVVAPAIAPTAGADLAVSRPMQLFRFVATETAAGLALGAALRLMVQALQMAGAIIAQSTSLSQLLGSSGPEPQPAIAQVMYVSGLALAMTTGLHLQIAEAIIMSYGPLPAGRLPDAAAVSEWGIGTVARAFAMAFSLAAPFAIGALLYNVALGVINRAMPQLMVAFVGAPAITAGGLVMLLLALPALLSVWNAWLMATLANPYAP